MIEWLLGRKTEAPQISLLRIGETRTVKGEDCLVAGLRFGLALGGKRRSPRYLRLPRLKAGRFRGNCTGWNYRHGRNDGRTPRKLAPRNGSPTLAIHESPRASEWLPEEQTGKLSN